MTRATARALVSICAWLAVPGAARACDGPAISVLTLNAWGLPRPVARDRRVRLPHLQQWVKDQDVDVVGLQEVWHGALSLLDLDLIRPRADAPDAGLAIVTPHPVRERASLTFREASGVDRLKGKGVMSATIDLPDAGPTAVYVTHLQAGSGDRAAAVRSAQVDELLAFARPEVNLAMLLGDFNLYAESELDHETARRLAAAGWADVAQLTGSEAPTYPGSGERFDRIYVTSSDEGCLEPTGTAVLEPELPLSDHLPVRAMLRAGP